MVPRISQNGFTGTGHWFLEGCIGDFTVDFLVDSGSSVMTLSMGFFFQMSPCQEVYANVYNYVDMSCVLSGTVGITSQLWYVMFMSLLLSVLMYLLHFCHTHWPLQRTVI